MKLIVNLICQDSEPELPALLESLKGRVDGLVAVDGGSTDRTVEILTNWGAENTVPVHVKRNAWPDDFALQRNLCLNVTRAEYGIATPADDIWVLMIDSDDQLTAFDRTYIDNATTKAGVVGLLCHMDNGNGFFNVLQLFRLTSDAVWENPIHEYVQMKGPKGLPPADMLTIKRGRSAKHNTDPARNVRIGRQFVESSPDNSRGRFYLARDLIECHALPAQQRLAEAEGHLRAYLAMGTGFPAQDRYARLLLTRLMCDCGRVGEARRFLLDSIEKDPDNKSAYEALSRISEGRDAGVWFRLSAAAEGNCVLPYGSKLPVKPGGTA